MRTGIYDKNYYDTFDRTVMELDTVAKLIMDLIQPSSVIDLGCGVGNWLVALRKHGAQTVQGIDGTYISKAWLKIPQENFRAMDLNDPQPLEETYDLAISVEVAEHLKPERARAFVGFLTSLAPVAVFSAAIPFQGGTEHVNEQWPSYWAALFNEHDYVAVDYLRKIIWDKPEIPYYYRQNILIYVHTPYLQQNPNLHAAYLRTDLAQLDVVHPVMLENIYLKRALKLLGQSSGNAIRKRLRKQPSRPTTTIQPQET